jgi:hypothetical protein
MNERELEEAGESWKEAKRDRRHGLLIIFNMFVVLL